MRTLAEGKVPWDLIADKVRGALPPEVLVGPSLGEDAALVRIGGEVWAVASDPVSFTGEEAGRLSVIVNANDIAVRGARPLYYLAVVLVSPAESSPDRIGGLLEEIRAACAELGVALIGGHTEVTPGLSHSVVVGTMLGRVEGKPITTGGLRPGDWVGMTKWAGLEGTAILLAELGDRLRELHGPGAFRPKEEILAGEWLTVVPEARIAAANPSVCALHDVTEGGVAEALHELACASGVDLEVDREKIPVLPETRVICEDLGMDPLGLIGSGALLVGCGEGAREGLAAAFANQEIPFTWLGRAVGPGAGTRLPRFERDELLKAKALEGIRAVLFDMDGTIIDSGYDWPAIRRELGVESASIIEHLNGLESPQREEKWKRLRSIERHASLKAKPKDGAAELLALLRSKGLRTALATNNTEENTRYLLDRFGLRLDEVITRDSGVWKPSGAPLTEALRRLDVPAKQSLAVGDSRYDVLAARDAGCGRLCLLYPDDEALAREADLSFSDIPAFLRYLRLVL